jgi:hypothetical protein
MNIVQKLLAVVLISCAGTALAQITPTTTVDAGSAVTYTWTGASVSTPVWQVTNGSKNASGSSVDITWNTNATSGAIVFLDGTTYMGSVGIYLRPAPPGASAPTTITANSFTANWAASTTATSYQLDVSTSSAFSSFVTGYNNLSVSSTSQSVTGLTTGTIYYYRVRGLNSNGASASSATTTVSIVPPAPVALSQTSVTTTSLQAMWAFTTSATGYQLDVSTDVNFSTFVGSFHDFALTALQQSVTSLSVGTNYYYRVRAVNAGGLSAYSNVITAPTITNAPGSLASSVITPTGFTASWGSVTTATSYRLDVSASSSFASFVSGYNNLTVSGTSQAVSGLSGNTTYYFRVRAVNSSGTSASSSNGSALTLVGVPVTTASTPITANSFTVNWGAASGAATYAIDVSTSSAFSTLLTGYNSLAVSGTSQSVGGLAANTTYYFRVRGVNGALVSTNSATGSTLTATSAPGSASPNSYTEISFTANWGAATGATSYRLDVSTTNAFSTFVSGYSDLMVSTTSASVTGLTGGTTYYYRVRAVNASGPSANSVVITALTKPAAAW